MQRGRGEWRRINVFYERMYVIKFENKELHPAIKPLKQDRKCGSAIFWGCELFVDSRIFDQLKQVKNLRNNKHKTKK
jgi:hypothetical protein